MVFRDAAFRHVASVVRGLLLRRGVLSGGCSLRRLTCRPQKRVMCQGTGCSKIWKTHCEKNVSFHAIVWNTVN